MSGFTDRMGGGPNVRRAAYGAAVAVFLILAGFGVFTLDDAERWLAIAAGVLGMGTGGLALRHVEDAPDAAQGKAPAVEQIVTVTHLVQGIGTALDQLSRRVDALNRPADDAAGPDPVLAARLALEDSLRAGK